MLQFINLIFFEIHYSQEQNNANTMNFVAVLISLSTGIYIIYNRKKIYEKINNRNWYGQLTAIRLYAYLFIAFIISIIVSIKFIIGLFK